MNDELIRKNRTYRRFDHSVKISEEMLLKWVQNLRYVSSGINGQYLRFFATVDANLCDDLRKEVSWAGALKDWHGPTDDQAPVAWVVILRKKDASPYVSFDAGLAAQTLLLQAASEGFGGCIFASGKDENMRKLLGYRDDLELSVAIALGKPAETVVVEEQTPDEKRPYWRTDDEVHHVPKLSLNTLLKID